MKSPQLSGRWDPVTSPAVFTMVHLWGQIECFYARWCSTDVAYVLYTEATTGDTSTHLLMLIWTRSRASNFTASRFPHLPASHRSLRHQLLSILTWFSWSALILVLSWIVFPPPVFNLCHCALTHSDVLLQWVIAVIVISKELLCVIVFLLLFLVQFLGETFALGVSVPLRSDIFQKQFN